MRLSPLLLASLLALGAGPVQALDYVWLGGTGSWTDANKWSLLGLPGSGDTATLSTGSAILDSDRLLDRLIMAGGNRGGSGLLTSGALTFSSGSLFGPGTTTITGAASFSGSNNQYVDATHTLNLNGGASWSAGSGTISVGSNARINVATGTTFVDAGTLNPSGNRYLAYSGNGSFNNAGTYERNGLGTTHAYGFNNSGTLKINAGTMLMRADSSSSGQIQIASGAVLDYFGGNATISGSVSNAGLLRQSAGNLTLTAAASIDGALQLDYGNFYNEGSHSVASLGLAGGNRGGSGLLTAGALTFSSGSLFGPGTTTITGAASFSGSNNQYVDATHTLNLNGGASWSAGSGTISVGSNARINVATGTTFVDAGTLNPSGNRYLAYSGSGSFNNAGTYERNGLGTTHAYGFNNSGTLKINAGTMLMRADSSSSGQIQIASGAVLDYSGGNATISGSVSNAGLLRQSAGNLTLTAAASIDGALQLDYGNFYNEGSHSVASLGLAGGNRGGSGLLTAGALTFSSGSLFGPGTTTITGAASFSGSNNQYVDATHTLNLNGGASWSAGSGTISVGSNARINVASGTTFVDAGILNPSGNRYLAYSGNGSFNNAGTYERNGLGTTHAYGFNNSGTLKINAGTMLMRADSSSSGQIQIASGAVLDYSGGNATISGSVSNAGLLRQSAGNLTLTAAASIDGALQLDYGNFYNEGSHSVASLGLAGGNRGGSGLLTAGALTFSSGSLFGPGTTTITGAASFSGSNNQYVDATHTLNLNGGASWSAGSGTISVGSNARINVAAGTTFVDAGTVNPSGNRYLAYSGNGSFNNAGTYERNGLGTTQAYGFNNSGQIHINSGTFLLRDAWNNTGVARIAAGASLSSSEANFNNHGRLEGDGMIRTAGQSYALLNLGELSPGSLSTVGQLAIDGDLTLGSTSVLDIDLASLSSFDAISISSDLRVGGVLKVESLDGFGPQVGDSFKIATFSQLVGGGRFSQVQWLGSPGLTLSVDYNASDITLRVTAVPEPSSWALMFSGLALFGWLSSRRHRVAEQ
ncbi:PEP-CTERM sorting domain-containing protein [Paucibacter sp. B51]|uniref:PEP-CTERM sorting domain-containing protein n=1 Tax=Paucibacter sp. B51 TaxID=2993315 RepID=UPI0022EBF421|nr:PEP-CTERM sorting domain-containing protein [Paucibacter sp. B51]